MPKTFKDLKANIEKLNDQLDEVQIKSAETRKRVRELRGLHSAAKDDDVLDAKLEALNASIESSTGKLAAVSKPPKDMWPC